MKFPEPAPTREETLRSSGLVAELEAVASLLTELQSGYADKLSIRDWERMDLAKICLGRAIATERRRSASD